MQLGGAISPKGNARAKYIKYGFKAPVSMVFTSLWAEFVPNLKVLHSVRDGRDIAFSKNQGPVEKFYNDMYTTNADLHLPITHKAIKLWSDWNSQVYQFSQNRIKTQNNTNANTNITPQNQYDYFLLHSEDLIRY